MAAKTISKEKLKTLTSQLSSGDEKTTLKVLKQIRTGGNELLIPVLVEVLADTTSEKVQTEVLQVLFDLKNSKATPLLIEALDTDKGKANRAMLVSVFWQANLQPADHIDKFVEIAIEGDYMETLECLTVIENLDGPFEEEPVMESLLKLKSYFSGDKDEQKHPLLESILEIVQKIDGQI